MSSAMLASCLPAESIDAQRARVVQEARAWLGTKYHHGARVKGAGIDCVQLIVAVWDACGVLRAADADREAKRAPYSAGWHLHQSAERYLEWIGRYCVRTTTPAAGDLVLFRFGRTVSHGGIISEAASREQPAKMIHAYGGSGVMEEDLLPQGPFMKRLHSSWSLASWAQ